MIERAVTVAEAQPMRRPLAAGAIASPTKPSHVRLASAIWWPSHHTRWEHAESPDGIRDIARSHGEAVTAGRLDLEFVDVSADDIEELVPWLGLIGITTAAEGFLRSVLIRSPDVTIADSFGEGEPMTSVVLPFTRFVVSGERLALSGRQLWVIATRPALIRLWSPRTVIGEPTAALEPSTIGHAGTDTLQTVADPETGDAFPSVLRRQRDVPPAEGLIDEIHAAGEGILRAATGLGDAVLSWHGRFYATGALTGEPAEREAAALAVLGEAAQTLVGDRRSTLRVVAMIGKRLQGSDATLWPTPIHQLQDDENAIGKLGEAWEALNQADERLGEARNELRDAASLIASTAATTLLRVQQADARRTASFERRVSILAGVITGPAVVAGVAGANVDFWPLPGHDGTLARGSLIVLVGLAVAAGFAAFRYLRP
jgi:hypothetical protein